MPVRLGVFSISYKISRSDERAKVADRSCLYVDGSAAVVRASRFNFLVMEHVMHPYMFKSNTPRLIQSHTSDRPARKPGAIRLWLRTAFRNWERRRMIETLRGMDDHLLRDIGIDRSDIPRAVDVFTDRELGMRPVASDAEPGERRRGRPAAQFRIHT